MQLSFAVYACTGFLDIKTNETVPIDGVKDIMVSAVRLDFRNDVKKAVDHAWDWMCEHDARIVEVMNE